MLSLCHSADKKAGAQKGERMEKSVAAARLPTPMTVPSDLQSDRCKVPDAHPLVTAMQGDLRTYCQPSKVTQLRLPSRCKAGQREMLGGQSRLGRQLEARCIPSLGRKWAVDHIDMGHPAAQLLCIWTRRP